jgi:hypothetical protein
MSTQNLVDPSAQKIEWAARKFGISAWQFGDSSRSRYGRKPPTNEFLMQLEPKLFTVGEKNLGRDEIRYGFI